jgi:hypothetical protein
MLNQVKASDRLLWKPVLEAILTAKLKFDQLSEVILEVLLCSRF